MAESSSSNAEQGSNPPIQPSQPIDFTQFQGFMPDGSNTTNSYENILAFDPRNLPPWPLQNTGQSPHPPVFMPNIFQQSADGSRPAMFPPTDYRMMSNTLTSFQPWMSSPLTFIPAAQWAPQMEFHNVTESDMRERGKAAAAAGKNLENPFVINQGLPPEYRTFPFPPLGVPPPPQQQQQQQVGESSSATTPSFFVGVPSPFVPASSPFPSQPPQSYPPTPVNGSPQPISEADLARVAQSTQQKATDIHRPDPSAQTSNQASTPVTSAAATASAIAMTETANRARRLKLFQETSEESFEESLMNGGYGMYRTSDHVPNREPLPAANPLPPSLSNIPSPAPPLSAKEAKKRKRLAAFLKPLNRDEERKDLDESRLKVYEIEGMGRILSPASPRSLHKLPVPQPQTFQPEEIQPKKRGGYRKRRPKDVTALEKPDWPDSDFYWRLRIDERQKDIRFEQDEKMKMINGYLDSSSDDEDRDHDDSARPFWRLIPLQEGELPSSLFSTDLGDAQAVLMSKRSSRAFAHRRKRRRADDSDDTDDYDSQIDCLGENCRRPRSSRGEVQCDHCKKWFHLSCIGVRSVKELGPEDSNWYCDRCDDDLSETPKGLEHLYHPQPVLVPSRPETPIARDYAHNPSTPSNPYPSSPTYPVTPFTEHRSDTPVFDPTSTPSRGMKIHPSTGSVGALWAGGSFKSDTWTPKNVPRLYGTDESPSVARG